MPVNQSHILMLAAVSIFTGMIAPSIGANNVFQPYALTNMQYVAFLVLFLLSGLFLLSNFRFKKTSHIISGILIVLILMLAVLSVMGVVKSLSGSVLQSFSWGWIFLFAGMVLLLVSLLKSESFVEPNYAVSSYERMVGGIGFVILFLLTIFVIFVAIHSDNKKVISSELSKIFTGSELKNIDSMTMTAPFRQIDHFFVNRAPKNISFVGYNGNTGAILYPQKIKLTEPFNIEALVNIASDIYIVQKNGSVLKDGKIIGVTPIDYVNDEHLSKKNFLFIKKSNGKYELITEGFREEYTLSHEKIDKIFFDDSTQSIFYIAGESGKKAVYRGMNRVTDEYFRILRFSVGSEGSLVMVTEDENHKKQIIRDGAPVHFMQEKYITGTFKSNGNDFVYVTQNDDESFSLVFNGTTLERKLDEIRNVFLSKKGNFGYFGRSQGEANYCYFTRYNHNVCGLSAYMNPSLEADSLGVIFLGKKDGEWKIYRDSSALDIVTNYFGYEENIAHDYFFFDPTRVRNFLIIKKTQDGYIFNKRGKEFSKVWKNFDDTSIFFDYDSVFIKARDNEGWRIVEL